MLNSTTSPRPTWWPGPCPACRLPVRTVPTPLGPPTFARHPPPSPRPPRASQSSAVGPSPRATARRNNPTTTILAATPRRHRQWLRDPTHAGVAVESSGSRRRRRPATARASRRMRRWDGQVRYRGPAIDGSSRRRRRRSSSSSSPSSIHCLRTPKGTGTFTAASTAARRGVASRSSYPLVASQHPTSTGER